MNRPFLRELAKRAGYTVSQRSNHGASPAWDWGPKQATRHFLSEEAAWKDLENNIQAKMVEADKLFRLAKALVREKVG